jgi:CxxC motif-containing protein (DUF1111 family)
MKTWAFVSLALVLVCSSFQTPGGGGGGPLGQPPLKRQAAGGVPPVTHPAGPQLGGPLEGLTHAELAAFERGKVVFERRFQASEGLGPFYNATSCQSCHSTPVTGGSAQLYRNFYLALVGSPGFQFPLLTLPSAVIPAYGSGDHLTAGFTLQGGRTVIPSTLLGLPVTVAQRNAPPLFGVGLFEFVSNAAIFAHADPDDIDGDGISGRFNVDAGAIGRFGYKAQSNNIELFTRAPLQNQLGITSDPFLGSNGVVSMSSAAAPQVSSNPNAPTKDNDGVPDPEISSADLGDLIAYTRFLAPPRPKPFDAAAQNGKALFAALGCVKCHIPSLPSSRGPVDAYTDLLIHDMGPGLADGISFGSPQASMISSFSTAAEFRTQPLWGVSLSAPFLHDGRAETLEEAIALHGGEAAPFRDAFLALPQPGRDDVVRFLEHL